MSSMKCTGACCPIPELTKGVTICTAHDCKYRTEPKGNPEKTCNTCACDRICDHNVNGFENCGNWIDKAVLEPEKTGRWIIHNDGGCNNWCECSECNTIGSPQWKRCPVCEAKMEPVTK